MNLKSTFKLLLGLGLLFFFSLSLTAQNQKISIQGTLKDASGASVPDGEVEVTFKLYHEGSNDVLWDETATVPVIGGIYSHNLGSVESLAPASIFNQPLFLGITVGGRELNPRTELTYAPYAISVASTQQVAQGGCSGQVGDIKYSILAPDDFARENGDCWVPMDGRSIDSGNKLRDDYGWTRLPDMEGNFIRAHGGNSADVGVQQSDAIKSHNHGYNDRNLATVKNTDSVSDGDSRSETRTIPNSGESTSLFTGGFDGTDTGLTFTLGDDGRTSSSTGISEETRPQNMSFYIYIRIN